jgi:hypothetical protein
MDFISDLPPSKKFNKIMVIVDKLTKYVVIIPTTGKLTEIKAAKLFKEHVITKWGMPKKVISNRDPLWRKNFWKQLLESMGTE